jgi:hypothetical protein
LPIELLDLGALRSLAALVCVPTMFAGETEDYGGLQTIAANLLAPLCENGP